MPRQFLNVLEELGKFCCLDFEFNRVVEEKVNLVSCVTHEYLTKETKKFWLHNNQKQKECLRTHLKSFTAIVGYSCVAECRSFISLGLDPLEFKWVDLFLEYRMITNHNDKLNWGMQLHNDGKVKKVYKPKPKYERTEEDLKTGFKPTHSLAEATYKLTGEIRDTIEKDECRQLIISDPEKFTESEQEKILEYNSDDVEFLPEIFKAILMEYGEIAAAPDWSEYLNDAEWRGRYAAHTAKMESLGYPINLEATKNFSNKIPAILAECQADINRQFKNKFYPFKWNAKTNNYSWDQKAARQWIEEQGLADRWMRTEKDQLSLALDAWEKHFRYQHYYPENKFGAQIVRYLKLKQSLYGFSDSKGGKRKNFWDSVGSDGRVRPYLNIYGAQSGRSQPGATGLVFLKPAWQRVLVEPKSGRYLAGIDFGSQEFFIAALLSEDEAMIEAYTSGDPYLYMAKKAGTIPEEGTRETHARERDLMKATTLGILFSMTKYGLSNKLTADTGIEHTEEEAQELIDTFEDLFPVFTEWKKQVLRDYEDGFAIKTLDGFVMWCDNSNPRSVTNVPIQGAGASIMRKAVDLAVEKGVRIIFTLHDAIYIEAKISELDHIEKLHAAMREGFAYFFEGTKYFESAKKIRLDPKAWGPGFPEKGEIKVGKIKVPVSNLYIDPRAKEDFIKFSKFFSNPETELL